MYITFEEYVSLYDAMDSKLFARLSFEAFRVMDNHTTGIDGVKKLKMFPPAEEYKTEAVRYCAAKIINLLYQIQEAESSAEIGRGYIQTDQGLQRKIISRVEAGNEAISYSETKLANSTIDAAVADRSVRDNLLADTVKECLSGISDANGVSLLYMGPYPRRFL